MADPSCLAAALAYARSGAAVFPAPPGHEMAKPNRATRAHPQWLNELDKKLIREMMLAAKEKT